MMHSSAAAANQLLAYGGYGRHASTDYDASAYNYSNLTAAAAASGALVTYAPGYMTAMDGTPLYNRQCDYNAAPYNADCVSQSALGKSKRRVTSSVTSSPPANHGADTCYYKKQRLVGAGYAYDATTTSSSPSSSAAVGAGPYSHAFDVINHA